MARPLFVNRFLVRFDAEERSLPPMRYDPELRLTVTSEGEPLVDTAATRAMATEKRTLPQSERDRASAPRGEHHRPVYDTLLGMDTRLGTRGRDPDPERCAGSSLAAARTRRVVSAERPLSSAQL